MKPLRYSDGFYSEVANALSHSPDPDRFRNIIEEMLLDIGANPQIAATIGSKGFRQLILVKYPYSIVYKEEADEIKVVAFPHSSQRTGYWIKRTRT